MGASFSCQMFLTPQSSAQGLKGREPERCKEKQKGKYIWKLSLLFIWGAWWVIQMHMNASVGCCLLTAWLPQLWKTATQDGWVSLTRPEVAPDSNVFHSE